MELFDLREDPANTAVQSMKKQCSIFLNRNKGYITTTNKNTEFLAGFKVLESFFRASKIQVDHLNGVEIEAENGQ